MALVFNDTTTDTNGNRIRNGLIQICEDTCGLGDQGITSNPSLMAQFTRWMNIYNKIGFNYAILSFKGWDIDDPNYTTYASGTFTGAITRDYNLDASLAMLKIKQVNISYDGFSYVPAFSFDDNDELSTIITSNYAGRGYAINDPNIDTRFDISRPYFDLISNGFKIYPKFTQAQLNAAIANGTTCKVWVEFFRAPREFQTVGTETYTTGFDIQFAHLPALGASYEYCKLYKPDVAASLQGDLYGARTARGILIRPGLIQTMQEWYNAKQPNNARMSGIRQNNK